MARYEDWFGAFHEGTTYGDVQTGVYQLGGTRREVRVAHLVRRENGGWTGDMRVGVRSILSSFLPLVFL